MYLPDGSRCNKDGYHNEAGVRVRFRVRAKVRLRVSKQGHMNEEHRVIRS